MFDQSSRLIRLECPLPEDSFAVVALEGQEAVSAAFELNLDLLSGRPIDNLDELIGQSATLSLSREACQTTRNLNGIISAVSGATTNLSGLYKQTLRLSPWFSALQLSSNCKSFQNKNVVDIVSEVLRSRGFNQFETTALTYHYAPIGYCVQYNETDYDFIHRLLEQAGIYYYFNQSNDNHTLVLSDALSIVPQLDTPCLYDTRTQTTRARIYAMTPQQTLSPNVLSSQDYHFTHPRRVLGAHIKTANQNSEDTWEHYHYPGRYQTRDGANRTIELEAKRTAVLAHQSSARSDINWLMPGYSMQVDSADAGLAEDYLMLSLRHWAVDYSQISQVNEVHTTPAHEYSNQLSLLSRAHRFCPPLTTPWPQIRGVVPAMVVGPEDEEIYTDRYGRVKVQFPWDREGKYDAHSSCWVRVARLGGGNQFGSQYIPQVGDEVGVMFIDANPDRPVIVSSCYHRDNQETYNAADHPHVSAITTHTQGSDDITQGHKLVFDDSAGRESLSLRSEDSLSIQAQHNLNITTQGGEKHAINRTGKWLIAHGSGDISAGELHIQAGGTTVVMDSDGIKATTGGKVTSASTQATTTDADADQNGQGQTSDAKTDMNQSIQTDQPNMYPKVTLEFESNTLALNEYVDGPYHIRTTATVSGTLEMINIRSVNPANANQQALKIQARAAANQLFAQLKVEKIEGDLPESATMTLGLEGNDITISLSLTAIKMGVIILRGNILKSINPLIRRAWKISGDLSFQVIITATKKSNDSQTDLGGDFKKYLYNYSEKISRYFSNQSFELVKDFASQPLTGEIDNFGYEVGEFEIETGQQGMTLLKNDGIAIIDFIAISLAEA
jgi:type VI secretion system secreted protein VgrG